MVADEKEERDGGRKIAVKPKSADKYMSGGLTNAPLALFLIYSRSVRGGSEFHAAGPECQKA